MVPAYRHGKHRSTSGWFLLNLQDPQSVQERIELLALNAGAASNEENYY